MMTHGFTAWPSDSPLGGGGFVDLTGAKNAPIETKKDDKPSPVPPMVPTVADWVKRMTNAPMPPIPVNPDAAHCLTRAEIEALDSPGPGYSLVETDGGLCWLYFGGGPGGSMKSTSNLSHAHVNAATSAKFQQALFDKAVKALEGNAFIRAFKTQYAKSEKAPEQIPFPEPSMASIALMGELRDATARWFEGSTKGGLREAFGRVGSL